MKPKPKNLTNQLSAADRLAQRKFNEAIGWIQHLEPSPKPNVKNNSSSDALYASALNVLGLLFVRRLTNLANRARNW